MLQSAHLDLDAGDPAQAEQDEFRPQLDDAHGGAVRGYRAFIAFLPEQDVGIVALWNSESALPSGLLPTIIDSALGLSGGQWLDEEVAAPDTTLYASGQVPAGVDASAASASPE